MGGGCTLEELGDEIYAAVAGYLDDVERASEEDVRAAAQVTLGAVIAGSPERSGRYARGWAMEPDAEDPAAKAYRIHNKAKPGLTHLLEKGHGGPHPAPPHPHIADAAQAGIDDLERRIHA